MRTRILKPCIHLKHAHFICHIYHWPVWPHSCTRHARADCKTVISWQQCITLVFIVWLNEENIQEINMCLMRINELPICSQCLTVTGWWMSVVSVLGQSMFVVVGDLHLPETTVSAALRNVKRHVQDFLPLLWVSYLVLAWQEDTARDPWHVQRLSQRKMSDKAIFRALLWNRESPNLGSHTDVKTVPPHAK